MVILIAVLAIILFALLILIGFAYLFIRSFEKIVENENSLPNQIVSDQDEYTPISANPEVPLEKFLPNFKKKLKIVYKETPQGVEEVEEEV